MFNPDFLGKIPIFDERIFQKGLVQPPTSHDFYMECQKKNDRFEKETDSYQMVLLKKVTQKV